MKSIILIVALCVLFQLSEQANSTVSVSSGGSGYIWNPANTSINAGDFVTWNGIGSIHNVQQVNNWQQQTVVSGGFRSGVIGAVTSFTFQFLTNGTYFFICQAHSGTQQGVIIVGSGNSPSSTTSSSTASSTGAATASSTGAATTGATGTTTGSGSTVKATFLLVVILLALLF